MFHASERLRHLLAGEAVTLRTWLDERDWRWTVVCIAVIVLGGGLYGATLGLWRDGLQAAFTAIKFPLLVFLTCGANVPNPVRPAFTRAARWPAAGQPPSASKIFAAIGPDSMP